MRLAVVFTKEKPVMFVSHLDVQRLFQRAFRRAKLPLAYSQGFNPHPLLSFATALSVGITSRCEYLDVMLSESIDPGEFKRTVSEALPEGIGIVEAFDLGESNKSLASAMKTADYEARLRFERPVSRAELQDAIDSLLSGEIVVMKKTKGGIKPTDIRPMVLSVQIAEADNDCAVLRLKGVLTASGGLNPGVFLNELAGKLGTACDQEIERTHIELDRNLLV